jgi:hypothetical protein
MRSIDWSKPVERVEMRPGEHFDVWVRDRGKPGAYGTTPGTTKGLGLEVNPRTGLPADRHVERFVVERPMVVMRSTAADFPAGVYPGVGGQGGGTQLLLPEHFMGAVRRVQ